MKTCFKLLFTFIFLSLIGQLNAQSLECIEDFENETPGSLATTAGNWNGIAGRVAFTVDATTNNTNVLYGDDGSGSSWMTNIVDYGGDWEAKGFCELCFDIRYIAGPNNPATGFNAITIFQNSAGNPTNTNPQNAAITATFTVNTGIGPDWVRVCVPIEAATGTALPSNALGAWTGPSVSDWNNLISNVSGIAFRLDFGGGANPAEEVYVDNICFEVCQGNDCDLDTDCPASNIVNLSTGVDASGNQILPGNGVVDPAWMLINNPPLIGCTNPLQASINGSAYVVNHNSSGPTAWANQAGVSTLAPVNLGTTNSFGCNNLAGADGVAVPYIFERLFCICQDEEVKIDMSFKGDDTIHFELIDLMSNTVLAISPGYRYPDPAQTWNYGGFLPAGSYAIRGYLLNTNSTTLGFSVDGGLVNNSGRNTLLSEGGCCISNPLVITKIIDEDCDGRVGQGDAVGTGWHFDVLDASGNVAASGQTNANGNLIINDLPLGTYTITETPQTGFIPGNPSTGSMTVTLNDSLNQVYFFNCPQPCGEVVRDTLEYACAGDSVFNYTFVLQNNTAYDVTSVILKNVSPSGVQLTPIYFNLFQNPIPSGGVSGPLSIDIQIPGGLNGVQEVCWEVVYIAGDEECCKFTYCITLEPSDPCESLSVRYKASDDDCCYAVQLNNDYCPDFFTSVVTQIITPGVIFGGYNGGTDWNPIASASGQVINWNPANGTHIPLGTLPAFDFCLDNIQSLSQIPQEVVVHWMQGRDIVCSDTLVFNCNPCMLFELGDYVCNDDGSITYNFTVFNTSGRTVTSFLLESHTANIQFDPAYFTTNIPDGGSYNGTVTVSTIDGSPLIPGTIVDFKGILFDDTDWCCHMDGLQLTIPECEGCECGEEEEWRKLFAQAYQSKIDCEQGEIQIRMDMTECDSIEVLISDATGIVAQATGVGGQIITLPILPNGNYIIEIRAFRYIANGELCFRAIEKYDLSIDCPTNGCDCNDETFFDSVNAGIDLQVDCDQGIARGLTKLEECDSATIRILNAAGNVLFQFNPSNSQSFEFNLPPNGGYIIEMEVYRYDENGKICMESLWFGQFSVDCPQDDCCGDEDAFIAVANAGYDIDFVCNGVAGPTVSVKPLEASDCDQISWQIFDGEGDLVFEATSAGNEGISFPSPGTANFRIQATWIRLNADGEPCFGRIIDVQDVRNECVSNLGPITMVLGLKSDREVLISWEVEKDVSYVEYFVVRKNNEETTILKEVKAEIGKTEYSYVDDNPLPGDNDYVVFGFTADQVDRRSEQRRMFIESKTQLSVKIMPNPAQNFTQLSVDQTGDYQVIIRDSNGKMIESNRLRLNAQQAHYLDVSQLPEGMVFIQIIDESGKMATKRLVRVR